MVIMLTLLLDIERQKRREHDNDAAAYSNRRSIKTWTLNLQMLQMCYHAS